MIVLLEERDSSSRRTETAMTAPKMHRRFEHWTTEELIDSLEAQKELMKNSKHKSNQGLCRIYDLEDELDYRETDEYVEDAPIDFNATIALLQP
jgi:hypothetical protein